MTEPIRLHELYPGVFWQEVPSATIPPYRGTACYWLTDGRRAWLVDAGDGSPAAHAHLLEAHRALSAPELEYVIVTHWHRDHSGGARGLVDALGAVAVAHPIDARQIAVVLDDAPVFEPPAALGATAPGRHAVELIHAPGHTPGQVNVWLPDLALLLAGDNVLGRSTSVIVPPDGHLRTYEKTLDRLLALEPGMIGPGHGEPITDGMGALRYYRSHRAEREQQVLHLLGEGRKSLMALAEAVYAGEAPETVAVGRLMLSAHVEALLEEGRIGEEGGQYFLR
ncbi:MAG: MBL fold metallo-hydrolase [Clostridia bacterium]